MPQDPDDVASDGKGRVGPSRRGIHRGRLAVAATVVLALIGLALLGRAAIGQQASPQPTRSGVAAPTTQAPSTASSTPSQAESSAAPRMPRSLPKSIDIPAIDAHAGMMTLGMKRDGTIQVPPLNETPSRAGWYESSPTPGQIGPAIVLGHVDSKKHGPAIFYRLGTLDRDDKVDITRADGTVARFRVDKVATYPKNRFPTERIYGATDHAALRLITCGGRFDPSEGSYENNIVAYASLIGEPAP